MDAPTFLVSAKKNSKYPIEIRVDIVHPVPADVFPAATVVRTLAQHREAIQGIHGHLQGVPINKEMNALRFRMGIAEEENASLRGRIKNIEAIDTITHRQEKRARMELERQLASVQEFHRQDQENFRKLQEFVTSQLRPLIDQTLLRNNTTDDGSQNFGGGPRRPMQPARVEKMELVYHISGCAVENQVKFANCTLLGAALTWWNGHTEKVDKYISGLPDNIHGNVMSTRPKTLDDAIELANDLMDQKLRTYAERQAENKRKLDNNNQAQQ
uniref:Reverse transcriptase domain-containing protein n=1 Tax=Tanacetum cinerariifolium TaxID=118510 RepID=A0A699JT26_TANCI|nr:reverse transcriptase domain-containing protein [Tanacetum cinerariifolium]